MKDAPAGRRPDHHRRCFVPIGVLVGDPSSRFNRKEARAKGTNLETVALCDVEIASGLRSALLRRLLSADRAAEALADYKDLPIRLHGHWPLLERIWELRNNFNGYDAAYVAPAERLQAEFLTADDRLA